MRTTGTTVYMLITLKTDNNNKRQQNSIYLIHIVVGGDLYQHPPKSCVCTIRRESTSEHMLTLSRLKTNDVV